MKVNASATPQANHRLQQRILAQLNPIIIVTAIFFTAISLAGLVTTAISITRNAHENSLTLSVDALEQQMEQIIADAVRVSTDTALRDYIVGLERSLVVATSLTRELIRQNPTDYNTIRYINRDGDILIEIRNQAGTPLPVAFSEGRALAGITELDAFRLLLEGETTQITLGDFDLARDANNVPITPLRLTLGVYAPVYLDNTDFLTGVLELRLDVTNLLGRINNANLTIFEPIPNRRLVLVDGLGNIVADSAQPNNAYLLNIGAVGGNVGELPVYQTLVTFSKDEANQGQVLGFVGGYLVSAQDLDIAGTFGLDWQLVFVDDALSVATPTLLTALFVLLLGGGFVFTALWLVRRAIAPILAPVETAGELVHVLARDEAPVVGTLASTDEDALVGAVQQVSQKINHLSAELTRQVRRRNRDVQVAGRIGREMATQADLESLVNRAINLICNELGFYHAQVFLVDELRENAVLRFSRGEAGRALLNRGHQLPIGSETVIGQVTARRMPIIVNDTTQQRARGTHAFNPLLGETRAEMGLPLIIGDEVIGVLDLQSKERDVFLEEDTPTYQLLADQLAIAIYNARLKADSNQRIEQINQLNRQLTRQAWQDSDVKSQMGRRYGQVPDEASPRLDAPISIRNEVIGNLIAEAPNGKINEGDRMILEAVAQRVALAIENARLFQETQTTLSETSTLYELSRRLSEADSLEDILRSIIGVLAPDALGGQVWLFDEAVRDDYVAQMVSDMTMMERAQTDGIILVGMRLRHSEHAFLGTLQASAVTFIDDVVQMTTLDDNLMAMLNDLRAEALAIVPIVIRGTWRGYLMIAYPQARTFNERERRVYEALIVQAGVAIDNRLLIQQTEDALTRIEKLYAASRIVNTAQTLKDLVYAAVATSDTPELDFWLGLLEGATVDDPRSAMTWTSHVRIAVRSEGSDILEDVGSIALAIAPESPMNYREPEIIYVPETLPEDDSYGSRLQRWVALQNYRFMAIFPLFSDNTPIALFAIVSSQPYELSDDDYEVYKALTGQMSTQIENQRLLQRTEEALAETRRLYIANRAITDASDLDGIFEAVVDQVAMPFVMRGSETHTMSLTTLLASPNPSPTAPELEVGFQWMSDMEATADMTVGDRVKHEDYPLAGLLDENAENLLRFTDLNIDLGRAESIRELLMEGMSEAAVVVPLRSRQNWYGAMILRTSDPDLLDERYVRFVVSVSDQVANAIERQRLLSEAESERANLNTILTSLPTGVLVLDGRTLTPLRYNERMLDLLGRGIDTTKPFVMRDYGVVQAGFGTDYPEDASPIALAQTTLSQQSADDLQIMRENGMRVDLLVNSVPVTDHRGQVTAVIAAFEDITALRGMEYTLQESLREQVTLYETQRALVESATLEEQLDGIIKQLRVQESDNVYIFLTDTATQEPRLVRNTGNVPSEKKMRALLHADIKRLDNLTDGTEAEAKILREMGMTSALSVPLQSRGRDVPLGWIVLLDEKPNAFDVDQERMLISIGDMATTSIDNTYLFQRTQEALEETESLYRATTMLSRTRDLYELGSTLQGIIETLGADMAVALILPDETEEDDGGITYLFEYGWESADADFSMEKLAQIPLPQRDGTYLADIARSTLGTFEREVLKIGDVSAFAGVNLRVKGMPNGRILLGYRQRRRFGESEMRFLNTVADSTSIMIDYQLLLKQLQNTLQETSILYQASRALIEISTPQEVVDVVVSQLIEPNITQVFIAYLRSKTWDTPGANTDIMASWSADETLNLDGVNLTPNEFPAWSILASEEVVWLEDIEAPDAGLNELEITSIESMEARSVIIIPLRVPTRVIGFIWLGSSEAYPLDPTALRIFQRFGEQTSLSLETGYLLEQTQRRARQLETSAQISQRVGTILDLDVLLPEVVDLIQQQFEYDHVQVFLMDEQDEYAELKASTGIAGQQLLAIRHKLRKGSDSVIGRVTADAAATIALDTADASVVHQPNPYLPLTRSEMALPLIVKGQVVGALDVQSNKPNAFIEEDIAALRTLAAQIAVAIDNARLYNESESRAAEMSFLFDITTTATMANDVNTALQLVAERIVEGLDALSVAIYLPESQVISEDSEVQVMEQTVVINMGGATNAATSVRVGDSENLIGIISATLQPQIVENIEKDMRYAPIAQEARSAIVTPVSSGRNLIGLIVIESERMGVYDNEALTLTLTLAGSLASVIQNALLLEQLQDTNERLREIDRLKSLFLANMSHELRTPLNSIIGFSRVMLRGIDGPLTEMQEQDLTTIYDSGNHLLNLINDILDQAKIEANELNLKLEYFDIKKLVEGAKSIAIGLLKDKPNLSFDVEVAPNLPQAYGDEGRSRQILINLISNAIKFTMEGGIRVKVYAIHNEAGDVMVRMDVTDTGIGIRKEDLSNVFEQFRQVDSSLTRTVGGTGLGLPISRSLAELQGGDLTVISELNVGSTFSITIPTHPARGEEASEEGTVEKADIEPAQEEFGSDTAIMTRDAIEKAMRATQNLKALPTKREVLLIEDNKTMVDQFRRTLQREGFEVQTADHPAYAQAMASNLRPNVIIMDVNFGGGEGWNILEMLKERDDTFDIPIIVNTLDEDSERAYRLGAHTFMRRPFAPEDLMSAVLQAEQESNRERILIIDDQPESIRLLMQLLSQHGNFRIFSAETGEEGISMVARRRPDLIILDLRMPNKDGFAVLNELRSNPETANIPVMVVTGEVDFSSDEQAILKNVHILHKGNISDEDYETFINDVKRHLEDNGNGA